MQRRANPIDPVSGREVEPARRGPSRSTIVLIAFLAIGGFFLLTEHRAHVFGFLPYLLVLACPLMHLFHHGGHGGHRHGHGRDDGRPGA